MMNGAANGNQLGNANVVHFVPRADRKVEENMVEFKRMCREDLAILGVNLNWDDWKWDGVGLFTKHGAVKGGRTSATKASNLLDPAFIDFAKSYVRYRHSQNPGEGDAHHTSRLQALRLLEQALLTVKGSAELCGLDGVVLDQAASAARVHFADTTAYKVGRELKMLAEFLSDGLVASHTGSWESGIKWPKLLGQIASQEGAAFRAEKLPDNEALLALAEIFNLRLDPQNPEDQRDVYTTSVTALLLSAPARAGEIHHLPANLEFEETDKEGDLHLGLRYEAFKGFGHYIKWVWRGMAPVARIAVDRIKTMTEESRSLARWLEDPKTKGRFYRHDRCPDVPDDQPLTDVQVAQALGFAHVNSITDAGLLRANGTYTLDILWRKWVLTKQPKYFPYVDKKKTLKFSEALFCMRRHQLRPTNSTSPVILWLPHQSTSYSKDITPSTEDRPTIFKRHGYLGSDGQPLRMRSHQLRHLLNTEAQRGGLSQEEIAQWSGRADMKQNRVYNHMSEAERVERARSVLRTNSSPVDDADAKQHWDVRLKPPPKSCSDLDLAPRGANHMTVYGYCEHDFLFSPCENFGECLNCHEHHCVKGAGKDDLERLERIKHLLDEQNKEVEAAGSALAAGDYGADKWYADQSRHLRRLQELVSILESKAVPDGSVVRLRGGKSQTHLHRVLRGVAMKALEDNTGPKDVLEQMMRRLQEESPGVVVHSPLAIKNRDERDRIFGALFQSIMDKQARRDLGAHYTSEQNILKALGPLFLDDLRAEFEKIKRDKKRLVAFHQKLARIKILDPACGCGNFLVIAYRELRLIELNVLGELYKSASSGMLDVSSIVFVDVDQFFGIELEEFPAQIAQVSLWMSDHQMNLRVSEAFGQYFARLPLKKAPNILHANALTTDWATVVAPAQLSYIVGNPPFLGHHLQSPEQKAQMLATYGREDQAAGVMDFVSAWYCKAAAYIQDTQIKVAFVSTNSITQGEQVGILWRSLMRRFPVHIFFAHKTFKWSNEARGKAAVYCVIIGFAATEQEHKVLYEYDSPDGDPHAVAAKRINAYLVDGPWVLLENRSKNLFGMPEMMYGSKPTDDGNYLLTDEEKKAFLSAEPGAKKFIKPFVSAHEYLHGEKRWVLWLVGATSADLTALPMVKARVKAVDAFRKASKAASTRAYPYPMLFRQVTQPTSDYIVIPAHSSETREFIPLGFMSKDQIVGNSCFSLPGARLFHFGVMMSRMHMAWVKYTCGRLESRYRYSKDIVYNNFPWPTCDAKQIVAIEKAAQAVLDARAKHPTQSPSDLYDPVAMPSELVKAHTALDKAVEKSYGVTGLASDSDRVAHLFERYNAAVAPIMAAAAAKPPKRAKAVKASSAEEER